ARATPAGRRAGRDAEHCGGRAARGGGRRGGGGGERGRGRDLRARAGRARDRGPPRQHDPLPGARAHARRAQRRRPHLGRLHGAQGRARRAAPAARALRRARREPDLDPVAPDARQALRVPVLPRPRGPPRRPARARRARRGGGARALASRARLVPARRRAGGGRAVSLADRVKPWIAALDPSGPGKPIEEVERELGLQGVVKLASNENPLGPSPKAVEAIRAALGGVHRYPDGASFRLRERLAAKLGVGPEQLVFGCGADEVLELVAKSFLGPGDECVFAWPSFAMYPIVTRGMGATPVAVPLDGDLVHDLDAMARAVGERTRVVFVCNPNNPTGTSVGAAAFERFAAALPDDVLLVVDEAYVDFARRPDFPDTLGWVRRRLGTLVIRTFSKSVGLAGLRVGYGIADPELAGWLERARHPFNVNLLAEVAALAAPDDHEHL